MSTGYEYMNEYFHMIYQTMAIKPWQSYDEYINGNLHIIDDGKGHDEDGNE